MENQKNINSMASGGTGTGQGIGQADLAELGIDLRSKNLYPSWQLNSFSDQNLPL